LLYQERGHLIAEHVLNGALGIHFFSRFDLGMELGHVLHHGSELGQDFRNDLGLWPVLSFRQGSKGSVHLGREADRDSAVFGGHGVQHFVMFGASLCAFQEFFGYWFLM
jgi:hypothetical protein